MKAANDYVLGSQADELARLEFQHKVLTAQAYALFQRAGLPAGQVLLDLGCGPGFVSFELAHVVGPTGKVSARDQSAAFPEFLAAERTRRGLSQIEPSAGPVEWLSLAEHSLDAVYARWLFCWLADPGAVLERVARFVRPGGVILLQEYLDWAAMKHVPRDARFDSLVAAGMRSWSDAKARIDIAEEIPTLAARAGLEVVHFQPLARTGRPGSLEWRWIENFFETYAPKLVERGLLTAKELEEWLPCVRSSGPNDLRHCTTPTMADIVLRRP